MALWIIILAVALIAGACLAYGGWWRLPMRLFCVPISAMTWQRQGLVVRDAASGDRVNAILRTFIEAFNTMITARRDAMWQCYCESRAPLLRAFAEEGVAMGYVLRHMGTFSGSRFERELVAPRRAFQYLHYVGLGFWSGMRNQTVDRVTRVASQLDPLYRYLVFDGYGFQRAFFEAPRNPQALDALRSLPGYAANAAHQGVGRALWFRYMDDPGALVKAIAALGEFAADAAAGVGLASTFVNPDRLAIPVALAEQMPQAWRPHFHLGMSFACKARDLNDPEWFSVELGAVSAEQRSAIRTAIHVCDQIEAGVRCRMPAEPYRVWRERMTDWLTNSVEFPLCRLRPHVAPGYGDATLQLASN